MKSDYYFFIPKIAVDLTRYCSEYCVTVTKQYGRSLYCKNCILQFLATRDTIACGNLTDTEITELREVMTKRYAK